MAALARYSMPWNMRSDWAAAPASKSSALLVPEEKDRCTPCPASIASAAAGEDDEDDEDEEEVGPRAMPSEVDISISSVAVDDDADDDDDDDDAAAEAAPDQEDEARVWVRSMMASSSASEGSAPSLWKMRSAPKESICSNSFLPRRST